METEKIEFSIYKELFEVFKNDDTEAGTLARVTIDQIAEISKKKNKGKDLKNEQLMCFYYGALGDLMLSNMEDDQNFDCYISIFSSLLNLIFTQEDEKFEVFKGKSIAIIKRMGKLEHVINAKIEVKKTKHLVNVLKYIIYSKTSENIKKKISQKSLENLLECTVNKTQEIRKESFRVFVHMFERDLHKNTPVMDKLIEFTVQNLEAWFMKKESALFTLYFLNAVISFFTIENVKKVIEAILNMMKKKSPPELRQMGCLVVEKLFEKKHIQTSFTENLLKNLFSITQGQFYSARSSEQVISMVQVLVQVYLNLNRGTPYRSKEHLSQLVNLLAELLTITDEQQTSFTSLALATIKSHVAKSIDLVLISSCDEHLFNPQEEMDLFSSFKIEKNQVDQIRENEGLQPKGVLKPREKLFVAIRDLASQRYVESHTYVLQIISSFVKRIEQIEMTHKEDVAEFLLGLVGTIKRNFEYSEITQRCLGKIVSSVSLDKLLIKIPVRVCQVDMSDPHYEEKSNSYILSLLSIYKTKGLFPHYFRFLWPQLKAINEKIEMQSMFDDGDQTEKLMLKNYKVLKVQLFNILKNCNQFSLDHIDQFGLHLKEITEAFLASSSKEKNLSITEKLAEPLRQALIFIYNNRKDAKKIFIQVKKFLGEKKLFRSLCIANSKVEKDQGFIASLIKIIILMIDQKKVEKIFKKNVERLSKFLASDQIQDNKSNKFRKNIRDVDTILLFLESMNNLHNSEIFNGILLFIQQIFDTNQHLLWKRGVYLAEELLRSVHHSYCPKIMKFVVDFYSKKMEKKNKKKKKNLKKNLKSEGGMNQENFVSEIRNDSESDRKVKDIVTRFLAEYIKIYFVKSFEEDQIKAFSDGEQSITPFARKFLPLAILSLKSRSSKTRDNAKKLLLRFDKAYEIASNEETMLLNLIVAGLAGKTSLMKSATIYSLALIFSRKFRKLDQAYIQNLIEVILIVVKEKNKETYRSIIAFFKFYVKIAEEPTLRIQLEIILGALFKWDEASQETERGLVKSLLVNIYRRLGSEILFEIVPEAHHKLVKNIEKQERRAVNLKAKGAERYKDRLISKGKNIGDSFDLDFFERQVHKILEKSGAEVVNEEQGMVDEAEDEKKKKEDLLLKFDSYNERFHFVKHLVFQIKSKHEKEAVMKQEKVEKNSDVYFDEKLGKLIIKEKHQVDRNVKRKKDYLDKELDRMENPEFGAKKRIIHTKEDGQTYASRVLERARKNNRNTLVHGVRESGISYMAKRGTKGDVRIPGKPSPHAFIQLNPIALQSKYRDRASQVFDFLMSKKKKSGAFKGLRAQLKKN